jgi:hypothetical protein
MLSDPGASAPHDDHPFDGLPGDLPFARVAPAPGSPLGDRACAVPGAAGPGGPDGGRDAPLVATPRELRAEAESVLDRLRRLARPARAWTRRSMDELDDVTGTLRVLQRRIAACGWTTDPAAMGDVVRARRCVDEALVLALVALDGLRGG